MNEKFIDELLKQYPDLEELLDYYIFVPEDVYKNKYCSNSPLYLSYNLVYDLITNERCYSYVYTLFYDFLIPGDNFCIGYIDGEDIYSIDVTRAKIARSILKYSEEGRLNFEGVYKDRIHELLEKTSFKSFRQTYGEEDFHRIVDGTDITLQISQLIDFLTLSKDEFQDFFNDIDKPYRGIPKSYFVYMVVSCFLNNALFDDFLFPEEVYFRYELLSRNELIDIEALNKIKRTLDSTIDVVKINPELRSAVIDKMDSSLSDLEKAIYIYVKLCKILTYDEEFYAVNQRGYVALKHENPERISTITPTNDRVVCYEFNSIYAKFLDELNIKLETISILNGVYKGHTKLRFRVDKFLVNADSVESILKNDLLNAKLNNPLQGLFCINKNSETKDEFLQVLSSIYKMVVSEENKTADVEKVETFEDILSQYEQSVDEELDLDTKLGIMLDKVIHSCVQGVDSIAYLLQLRKIIFSEDERANNIKISVVRDNFTSSKKRLATVSAILTINKNNITKDIFNNQYYFFHPNYPLVPVSIMEIQELFQDKMLEYIGNRYLEIPGLIIEEDSIDDKEVKGFK